MAIEAVNNVKVNSEPKKPEHKSSVMSDAALGFVGVSALTYAFKKDHISLDKVLERDTIELSDKATEEQKTKAKSITDAINASKEDKINGKLAEYGFINEETKEISAEDFLGKTSKEFEQDINTAKAKTQELEKAFNEAADDVKQAAKEALDAHKKDIDINDAKFALVKEGKITKEALKGYLADEAKTAARKVAEGVFEELKEVLPKERSFKKAAKYGAIGALIVGLGSMMFGGSSKTEASAASQKHA